MSIVLSPRLLTIARLVPPGARVIDVGTDHALLPVWLAQTGRARHVWASDLREGPLQSAAAWIEKTKTGSVVETRLADGLCGYSAADGDTVVIAGMGGETMVSILQAAPWVRDGILLILAPQSKQDVLRRYLIQNGFSIRSEALVKDGGRMYPILTAEGGGPAAELTAAELHTGAVSLIQGDPLFKEYLELLIRRAEKAAPYDPAAGTLLAELQTMKERTQHYDESV